MGLRGRVSLVLQRASVSSSSSQLREKLRFLRRTILENRGIRIRERILIARKYIRGCVGVQFGLVMDHSLWGHLPLLVRANSKESVEYILQALWRTRSTGLDAADRRIFRDMLQLPNDSDLDPVFLSLSLIYICIYCSSS